MNKYEAYEYIRLSSKTTLLEFPAFLFNLETCKIETLKDDKCYIKIIMLNDRSLSSLDEVKELVDNNDYIFILNKGCDAVIKDHMVAGESNYPGMTINFINHSLRYFGFTNIQRLEWLNELIKEKQTIAECKAKKQN